jgi:hypothetical protein
MKRLAIRAGLAVLGMVITLAWWTYRHEDSHTQSASHIPAKVWSGGNTLEVEVDSTTAATMRISFSQHDKPAGEQQTMEAYEKIPAGLHSWTVDVPAQVGGYIELQADAPTSGDKLTMKIKSNGHLVNEQADQLNGPLQSGTAFFVQAFFDDYSNANAESGENHE